VGDWYLAYEYVPFGAFVWTETSGMLDLRTFLPPRSGWALYGAAAINDAGQITGVGEHDGIVRGYLISPVDPSLAMTPPTPGIAGELNTVVVTGGEPGAVVRLAYARTGGGTVIPGCAVQTNALQLDAPVIPAPASFDATGRAEFTFFVPLRARAAGPLLVQAFVAERCAISNLVEVTFE